MSETNSLDPLEHTTDETRSPLDAQASALDAAGPRLLERLGVGGMGEVYRCGDDALQRDLALKVLRSELHGDAVAEERFLREARLTGSLQHPGVVPIHQLSRLADGRPCYTMKLVRGRTLADMLRDEPVGPERLPRLLGIVEKVCQAVAFAHSKGVIHRDLKPANVMVGEFGEVQVMDWGLAKELSRDEPAAPVEATEDIETVARVEEAAGLSRAGAALGTPAYMPPEQAAGDWAIVDERADVFALGAILCEVLTGKPPYQGANRDDLLRRARRGDVVEALGRLETCSADAALVQLVRECLSAEREGRPRNASVVAERLAAYQAEVQERLRRAEVERAAAQVKAREERKRRRLTLAVAVLVLLVLLLGGGGVWWLQREREKADQAVSNGLAQAELLADQARADPLQKDKYHQALEAARLAARLADGASADSRRKAAALIARLQREEEAAGKDRELLAALLDVRGPREGLKYTRDSKDEMMAMADEQFASAFRRWGVDVDGTAASEAAALLKSRPAVVVMEVSAALDEWASERRRQGKAKVDWQRLADLAALLDDDPGSKRRELREILGRGQLPVEHALGVLSAVLLRPLPILVELPLGRDWQRLRQLAEQTNPATEPILGLLTLVRALRVAGEEARAEGLLRAAIVARPREVVLHHALGELLTTRNPPQWRDAVECYAAARVARPDLGVNLATVLLGSGRDAEGSALLARLVQESPNNPFLHFKQAYALNEKGHLDESMAEYRKAIVLDPKYALAHNNLGVALRGKGLLDEAMAEYHKAIALDPKYAVPHTNLGNILHEKRRVDEAMAEYHKAIALDPKLALAHNSLGFVLYDKGRVVEATAEYHKAIALDPKLALAHNNLGVVLHDKGRLDEAMAEYHKAIALDPKDASAHYNLGSVLRVKGRLDDAIAEYHKAIALDPKLALAHNSLGLLLHDKGLLDDAIAEYRQAIALDPKLAPAHNNLGVVLRGKGLLDEAMAEYHKAIALDPKYAVPHTNLGNILHDKRRVDDAIAEYHKAIALDPKHVLAHNNLGNVLRAKGRVDEAMAEYRQAIALDPKSANAHGALGQALLQQGRFADAKASTRRALQLLPSDAPLRRLALQQLQQCDRMLALDKKLPAILKGEAAPANPVEAVALASLCQQPYKQRYAASARLYADAFAAEPRLGAQHRYNAACSAALAAAGKGEDAHLLPDKVAAMFRRWAMKWLRDDLAAYAKLAERDNPQTKQAIRQRLLHWQGDAGLVAVRDPQALARLGEPERAAWQALWREVEELLKRVAKK